MTTADPYDSFSQSYQEARGKFLAACTARGLTVNSHLHPLLGREGETLAMDVAVQGPAQADSMLLLSSACHGVEGFCGSAVQTAMLRDPAWNAAVAESGMAILYVHALNPYGFSWWRRTTHENVDLNRNFQDFSQALPRNSGYDELANVIIPPSWPPSAAEQDTLQRYAQTHGYAKLQEALSGGQYDHPHGIFFGGRSATWSHATLREVLRTHATGCNQLAWIDWHTGLGPAGVGERIFACRDDAAAMRRARAWWGERVTSLHDGSSTSAPLQGLMWLSAYQECGQAEYTGLALEFGTLPTPQMLDALRADQWAENHPQAPARLREAIKRQIRDAFYVDTPAWKKAVLDQSFDAAHGALRGLSTR